jgi:hypothetical protein
MIFLVFVVLICFAVTTVKALNTIQYYLIELDNSRKGFEQDIQNIQQLVKNLEGILLIFNNKNTTSF